MGDPVAVAVLSQSRHPCLLNLPYRWPYILKLKPENIHTHSTKLAHIPEAAGLESDQVTECYSPFPTIHSCNHYLRNSMYISSKHRCANKAFGGGQELIHDHQNSLYIGGVNIFHLQPNSSLQTDTFMGSIRNVVVRGVQLDLTCPADQINTIQGEKNKFLLEFVALIFVWFFPFFLPTIIVGVVRSHSCAEINCSSHRSSMCVDYAVKSYCQCLGGFSSHACNISNIRAEEISKWITLVNFGWLLLLTGHVKLNQGMVDVICAVMHISQFRQARGNWSYQVQIPTKFTCNKLKSFVHVPMYNSILHVIGILCC